MPEEGTGVVADVTDGTAGEATIVDPPATEAAAAEQNPWAWTEGLDPDKVNKTWNKFTETWDEVAREREELLPYKQLREAVDTDPALVEWIEKYYEQDGSKTEEQQIESVKKELSGLKQQLTTERELLELKAYAKEKGYPEFEEVEILKHAAANHIGNLRSAYHDKFVDQIAESRKQQALDAIKQSKGAATVNTAGSSAKATGFTREEIRAMSNEEFEKNRPAIMEQYAKSRA